MQLGNKHLGPMGHHDFGQCLCILCVYAIRQRGEKRKEEKENNYFLGWIKGEKTKSNMELIRVFYKDRENLTYLQLGTLSFPYPQPCPSLSYHLIGFGLPPTHFFSRVN